jgi:hypothetical protein
MDPKNEIVYLYDPATLQKAGDSEAFCQSPEERIGELLDFDICMSLIGAYIEDDATFNALIRDVRLFRAEMAKQGLMVDALIDQLVDQAIDVLQLEEYEEKALRLAFENVKLGIPVSAHYVRAMARASRVPVITEDLPLETLWANG